MKMRELLYIIKEWPKSIFCYPKTQISPFDSFDYDKYWKEKRGKKIGDLSTWQKERADYIINTIKNVSVHIELVDVGCGDGSILYYLKNNMQNITKCTGYDNSEFALASANSFGIEANKLDISDKISCKKLIEADYYLLLETLEHIPHSEFLLLEALQKARKGTFFSFPNTGYITHRLRLLFGKFPLQWRIFPNEHVRFWTYSDLKWWLKALEIEKYKIHCYKGVPILNRMFPSIFAAGFIVFIEKK